MNVMKALLQREEGRGKREEGRGKREEGRGVHPSREVF